MHLRRPRSWRPEWHPLEKRIAEMSLLRTGSQLILSLSLFLSSPGVYETFQDPAMKEELIAGMADAIFAVAGFPFFLPFFPRIL